MATMPTKKPEYSNVPTDEPVDTIPRANLAHPDQDPIPARTVPQDIDAELATPTPREMTLAKMAEENRKIPPRRYNVTNKNPKADRVVHDLYGRPVLIHPGETKLGMVFQPRMADQLDKGDLDVTPA